MRTVLYDYQESTASDIYRRIQTGEIRGAYLGFETGVGKTVTALAVAEKLYTHTDINNIVVICPVSKVDDWKRDLKYELPEIESTFVTSFQSAWREKASKEIIRMMFKKDGTILIIDEGHKMKTYGSKQSKFIQTLSDKFKPYVLILSATSQNKQYIDLYPQYKTLGSALYDRSAKDFKKQFCIEEANYNMVYSGQARFPFNEIVGYRRTDELDAEIVNYTYYKKYESTYDRPIEIVQSFKMTPEMKYFKRHKVWPKMDEKLLTEKLMQGDISMIDDFVYADRPALHHIYMRESCSGFIKDMFLEKNPKAVWLEDFLEGTEGRIVVFTNFINETTVVKNICDKQKRHCVIYDGANKDLSVWHTYEDCVAIVNIQAGSAGLNDFVKTNIAIYFSLPENYIDFTQSKGRLDRIGQTKQPVYYYLQIENSIEPQIYNMLKSGKSFDSHLFEQWIAKERG